MCIRDRDTVADHLLRETVGRISQAVDRHIMGSGAVLELSLIHISSRCHAVGIEMRKTLLIVAALYSAGTLAADPAPPAAPPKQPDLAKLQACLLYTSRCV